MRVVDIGLLERHRSTPRNARSKSPMFRLPAGTSNHVNAQNTTYTTRVETQAPITNSTRLWYTTLNFEWLQTVATDQRSLPQRCSPREASVAAQYIRQQLRECWKAPASPKFMLFTSLASVCKLSSVHVLIPICYPEHNLQNIYSSASWYLLSLVCQFALVRKTN